MTKKLASRSKHYARTEDLREGFTKKVAVLLDFVQMRGGGEGPAQIFRPLFTNCIYLGQFGDGEGGGHPCPNFLARWRKEKSGISCPNFGEGGSRQFGQNPKEQLLFSGNRPLQLRVLLEVLCTFVGLKVSVVGLKGVKMA